MLPWWGHFAAPSAEPAELRALLCASLVFTHPVLCSQLPKPGEVVKWTNLCVWCLPVAP